MKSLKFAAVATACIALSTALSAHADEQKGLYLETAVLSARYEEPTLSFYHAFGAVRVGYNFDKNFAAEVMAGTNLNSANGYVGSTAISARVESMYGAYLKIKAPVSEAVTLYARLGSTTGRVSANSAYARAGVSDSGASYGAGVQFRMNKSVYINADYMSYYSNNGVTVTAPSVGLGFEF